jgi:transcriptional regulator with XRE-family HTH domain
VKIVTTEFRDWLLHILDERGLSQSDLARAAKVSRTAISDALSGRRQVGRKLATAIAKGLKLPPEEVFRATGILPPESTKSELIERIANIFEELPADEKENIWEYIKMRQQLADKRSKKK